MDPHFVFGKTLGAGVNSLRPENILRMLGKETSCNPVITELTSHAFGTFC